MEELAAQIVRLQERAQWLERRVTRRPSDRSLREPIANLQTELQELETRLYARRAELWRELRESGVSW